MANTKAVINGFLKVVSHLCVQQDDDWSRLPESNSVALRSRIWLIVAVGKQFIVNHGLLLLFYKLQSSKLSQFLH